MMKRQAETAHETCLNKKQRVVNMEPARCESPEQLKYGVPQRNSHLFRPISFTRFLEEATLGSRSSVVSRASGSKSEILNNTKEFSVAHKEEDSRDEGAVKSNRENNMNLELANSSMNGREGYQGDEVTDILELISKGFKVVSFCGFFIWLLLLGAVFTITPSENLKAVNEVEFLCAAASVLLIIISVASKCAPLINRGSWKSLFSGVLSGALTVQFISICSGIIPLFFKIPIMIDPVTGAKVNLIRYCAWAPQAFMMTFFTEIAVTPKVRSGNKIAYQWEFLKVPILHSLAQGLSAFQGLVFPFCNTFSAWLAAMGCAFALFLSIFVRIHFKKKQLKALQPGTLATELETYERARISYNMLLLCAALWSAIALLHLFQSFVPSFVAPNSYLKHESLPFICETSIDVFAKALYLDVIVKLHNSAFDAGMRAGRRLEELKRMMLVVWECSADYIVLSVQDKNGVVTTLLSPSFLRLGETKGQKFSTKSTALMFKDELSQAITQNKSKLFLMEASKSLKISPDSELYTSLEKPLTSIRELVFQCWNQDAAKSVMLRDIELPDGTPMHCEGKLTRYKGDALIVVLRDISERRRRLEAEKLLLSEQTARIKDAEANRFTRHEVKNGLLACIELADCLKESLCLAPTVVSATVNKIKSNIALRELEVNLQAVYDTVLAVAMARDVINEDYEPKLERVDLCKVLPTSYSFRLNEMHRFPLVTFPSPFPIFMLDPQLVLFVHGNAVSNACKYGQKEGVVLTELHFLEDIGMIALKVINFPGDNYQKLLEMGEDAEKKVFAPMERLHVNFSSDSVLSSG